MIRVSDVLDILARETSQTAERRGKKPVCYEQGIADILEEIVEAMRADDANPYYIKNLKPEGYLVELADVVIATLTLMQEFNVGTGKTVGEIIIEKMEYNSRRED